MHAADGQFAISVIQQPAAQQPRVYFQVITTQPAFDHNFPKARGTENKLALLIFYEVARCLRETVGLTGRPKQQMRIEQQLHKSPWNSFSTSPLPIWSKSSGTDTWPVRNPTRFTCPASGAPNAITFTSGLPAFAITNGSPLAAWSTRRDRWVLASWILIVRIVHQIDLVLLVESTTIHGVNHPAMLSVISRPGAR